MEDSQPKTDLKTSVLNKIAEDSVRPRPKVLFLTRECAIWALWCASILIGAIAIAIVLFVASHQQYAIYEATHDNFLTFAFDFLPVLWLVTFALMAYVAVYNLRHTRHGYRYQTLHIISSSLFLSLFAGGLLQYVGFGYWVDSEIGRHVSYYRSQQKMELELWQVPNEGRLIGEVVDPTHPVAFTDVSGTIWPIETDELLPYEAQLLVAEGPLRVIGTTSAGIFHVCAVFPVVEANRLTRAEIRELRQKFKNKILTAFTNHRDATTTMVAHNDICRQLPVAKRMQSVIVQEASVQ